MKKTLKLLLEASGFFIFASGMLGPIYAIFVEEIGGNILTASGAWAIFTLFSGILKFFISKWEDHVKHQEKLLIIGYGMASLGFLGYFFVQNAIHLFIVQAFLGIATAIRVPAYDGMYSRNLDKGKAISEWGIWESMSDINLAISATIGGLIASIFGFKVLFLFMFVLSVIGFLISLRFVK